jgi:hypothetical protein
MSVWSFCRAPGCRAFKGRADRRVLCGRAVELCGGAFRRGLGGCDEPFTRPRHPEKVLLVRDQLILRQPEACASCEQRLRKPVVFVINLRTAGMWRTFFTRHASSCFERSSDKLARRTVPHGCCRFGSAEPLSFIRMARTKRPRSVPNGAWRPSWKPAPLRPTVELANFAWRHSSTSASGAFRRPRGLPRLQLLSNEKVKSLRLPRKRHERCSGPKQDDGNCAGHELRNSPGVGWRGGLTSGVRASS